MSNSHRISHVLFGVLALLGAVWVVRYYNEQPGYTDAYYHYNAAVRIAQGDGFVDDYLWTYIGAPNSLPAPSHLYWMPMTSILSAIGMGVFGMSFANAQLGLIVCLWGAGLLTYALAYQQKHYLRHAWICGVMLLVGGFFLRLWGTTDTFAPYALFGALALVCMGVATAPTRFSGILWGVSGVLSALGHLTRTDGLLLLLVGWAVLFLLWHVPLRQRLLWLLVFTLSYLLVMSPWFLRNLNAVGTLLPVGGTQAIWYTEYNDIFNFPPSANPQTFFADGIEILFTSRWDAFLSNLQHFIAVEGFIVLTPFMLGALWVRRKQPFWWGIILFAIGIHVAFTLVFPFPGVRGGLLHASSAMMPFWCVLGVLGIDDCIIWLAKRRRNWRPATAQPIFTLAMLGMVLWLSWTSGLGRRELLRDDAYYRQLLTAIPPQARVMRNDPAEWYYYTGMGGVVLPNEAPESILTIARLYAIDYVIFEFPNVPIPLFLETFPPFMSLVYENGGLKIYAIDRN
jgi:hypothetical protein